MRDLEIRIFQSRPNWACKGFQGAANGDDWTKESRFFTQGKQKFQSFSAIIQ
jgi:hypothetical protein